MRERPQLEALLRTGLAAASLPLLGGTCAARLVSRLPKEAFFVRSGRITARFCRRIETKGLSYADRDAVVARLAEVAQRELSVRSA